MKKTKLITNFRFATTRLLSLVANLFSTPVGVVVFVTPARRFSIRR